MTKRIKAAARERGLGPTIIDCINDPQIWQPWFKNTQTWAAWLCFVKALFGLGLEQSELRLSASAQLGAPHAERDIWKRAW